MIRFKALNVDGKEIQYEYKDAKELETIWRSDDIEMNVPENDAPIYDVEIDGKSDLREATFERIGTDSVWFEDLLTYLGIEIWGWINKVFKGGDDMRIVKTWCENTKEGEDYLKYNGYIEAKRILNTEYYICKTLGNKLDDVKIIL